MNQLISARSHDSAFATKNQGSATSVPSNENPPQAELTPSGFRG